MFCSSLSFFLSTLAPYPRKKTWFIASSWLFGFILACQQCTLHLDICMHKPACSICVSVGMSQLSDSTVAGPIMHMQYLCMIAMHAAVLHPCRCHQTRSWNSTCKISFYPKSKMADLILSKKGMLQFDCTKKRDLFASCFCKQHSNCDARDLAIASMHACISTASCNAVVFHACLDPSPCTLCQWTLAHAYIQFRFCHRTINGFHPAATVQHVFSTSCLLVLLLEHCREIWYLHYLQKI